MPTITDARVLLGKTGCKPMIWTVSDPSEYHSGLPHYAYHVLVSGNLAASKWTDMTVQPIPPMIPASATSPTPIPRLSARGSTALLGLDQSSPAPLEERKGTTTREAHFACWATNSWRAWEAIGPGENSPNETFGH
jgi:hypothetical protein